MNWLDMVLAGLTAAGLLKGWADGLLRQAVSLAALAAAIYLYSGVAKSFRGYLLQHEWFAEQSVTVASCVLAFVAIAGLILLAGWVMHKMISLTPLSLPNRLGGALVGLAATLFCLSLALNLLDTFDRRSQLISLETKVESRFYFHVRELAPAIYPIALLIEENR
ncbi:MAG: CvpA family protein [Tannerella sp.]|jgi:membrane protein required for colicin V production|nr:CvpA family protein [Tannerella sp.]